MTMINELEIISHQNSTYNIFLNEILYRTPHMHKDFEICLLLEGKLNISIQEKTLKLTENDLWVINPFQLHEYEAAGNPALVLIIQINPVFFSSYFSLINNIAFSSVSISAKDKKYGDLYESLIRIAQHSFSQSERYELKCARLLNYIFDQLMDFIPFDIVSDSEKRARRSRLKLIRQITSYIDENYYHKLLLSDVAKETNLTVNYLSHFFKDSIGVSFQKYLAKIRCTRACILLRTTDLSLFDISISCGFSDIKYFTKNFQEFYGLSTKDFRENSTMDSLDTIYPPPKNESFGYY